LEVIGQPVYPRQELGDYHSYTDLVDALAENGGNRRLGGDKPRHYIVGQTHRLFSFHTSTASG